MNRARAHDDEEPILITAMEDISDGFSGFDHERGGLISNRELGFDGARGRQRLDFNNVLVVDRSIHGTFDTLSEGTKNRSGLYYKEV